MKKGRQSGPGAFDLGFGDRDRGATTTRDDEPSEEDEYAAIAERYGVEFDDDADDAE